MEITKSMTSSSLHLLYERLKRVAEIAYKINRISFSKQGREDNFSVINKEEFQKATNVLYKCGNYEDSLLIYHMVVSIKTKWNTHNKIWRFWFYYQATINYYSNKKNQRKKFTIPDDLNNKAIEFKSTIERQRKYIEKTVTTPTGKKIFGHFIFNLTKS